MNKTLIGMLKTLEENEKKSWKDHLEKLAFAYNATVNKSTGFSPFFLMFGREVRLPIDIMFGIEQEEGLVLKDMTNLLHHIHFQK